MQHDSDSPPTPLAATPRWKIAMSMLAVAIWIGLLSGIAELVVIALRRAFGGFVTVDLLRMNRHALWMIPASNAGIFLAVGLLLSVLTFVGTTARQWIAGVALGTLGFGAALWRVPGFHEPARWVLAIGLGVQATRLAMRHASGFRRTVSWSLPTLLIAAVILGPITYRRTILAESRTLASLPAPPTGAPNVLLIVLDTVRADHLSLQGYQRDTTPNLKRRASEGVRFDQARSTAPWTLPSHASMLTGGWPHQLAADENHSMNVAFPTLAEFLSSRGFATAGFVANTYYCNAAFGLARGFARYEDCYENAIVSPTEIARSSALGLLANRALAAAGYCHPPEVGEGKNAERLNHDVMSWIDSQKTRPFFAFLNYLDAHAPYLLPEGDHRRFGVRPETPADFATLRGWHNANKEKVTPHQIDLVRDAYDDCIGYLDKHVGRLIDDLEHRGLLKNTVVIVTSDHGEHLGEHHIYGHGRSLYRQELHVPLLILAPDAPKGRVIREPASLRDLPATVAGLVGLGAESPFPGGSLASSWNESGAPSRPVLAEVLHQAKTKSKNPNRPPAWRGPMTSIVDNNMVYIRNADGREEIYDLISDPDELNDLAGTKRAESVLKPFRATLSRIQSGQEVVPVPMIANGRGESVRR